MMIFYAILLVTHVFYIFRKKSQLPTRVVSSIALICTSLIFTYLLERLLKTKISYLPIGYLFVILLFIKNYDRINMYDMSSNIISSIEKLQEYGYIVVDKNARYISSNENIKRIFPEIDSWHIDSKVPPSDSCLYQNIIKTTDIEGYILNPASEKYLFKKEFILGIENIPKTNFLLL